MKLPLTAKTISLIIILIGLTGVAVSHIRLTNVRDIAQYCTTLKTDVRALSFKPLEKTLQGQGIYFYDFTTSEALFTHKEENSLPLASLTKLMTVRTALKKHKVVEPITITAEDLLPLGSIGMQAGETYTYSDLIKAALIASSNDAAQAIAHTSSNSLSEFYAAMNAEAKNLGAPSLSFQSATGLDIDDTIPTATGSAKDILKVLHDNVLDFPTVMSVTTASKDSIVADTGARYSFDATNELVGNLPLLVAGKTGYTITAGGNLAVIWNTPDGHMLGAAVLGSTQDGRFTDVRKLDRTATIFRQSQKNIQAVCGE